MRAPRGGAGSGGLRPGPAGVIAIGIAVAAPERPSAAPGALGDDRPLAALRAGAELLAGGWRVLLDVAAFRVAIAADERTEAAALGGQVALVAQRAHLPHARHLGDLLRLLAGERLGVLALRIAGAAQEPAVAAEALDQHVALVARQRARDVGHLDLLGDLLAALGDLGAERHPEVADHGHPLALAAGHVVQLVLHAGREVQVDDLREVLHQQVRHAEGRLLREEAAILDVHVAALPDRLDGGRVGRRPPDAPFLQRTDQRGLGEARRWLGEVLLARQADQVQRLAVLQVGQDGQALVLLVVLALDVEGLVAVEDPLSRAGVQGVSVRADVDPDLVEPRRCHLRGEGPLPDEVVEPQLVRLEVARQRLRRPGEAGRAGSPRAPPGRRAFACGRRSGAPARTRRRSAGPPPGAPPPPRRRRWPPSRCACR